MLTFKVQVFLFKKLIKSENAWLLFDKAEINGFGVNLVRLYFPIYYNKTINRESFSAGVKKLFTDVFDNALNRYSFVDDIIEILPEVLELPVHEANLNTPYLDNYYFGIYDAAILAVMMQNFKPLKIIEIGSGISTRYMRLFSTRFSLNTQIICIDPFPRAEIKSVADKLIREPLEQFINTNELDLQSGDILFLDGSHYTFQGNDTLNFFFKCLPSLSAGTIIHLHDIYLPFDYALDVEQQLWTEQYIMAAMLMAGFNGFEILYPAYYTSQVNNEIINVLKNADDILQNKNFRLRSNHTVGFSFWMKKI